MRRWVARVCLLAAVSLVASGADAQKKKKGARPPAAQPAPSPAPAPAAPAAKPPAKKAEHKDIELDEGGAAAAVTAGQMTEEAATAKRLFDGERWSEAALGLSRVYKGETGDDAGNRQIAQYHLAIALYRLKFYQASYGIFSEIADKPNHLKFSETLLWLSKLATQLPEPADIVERVGKYTGEAVARFKNPQQIDLYWQLNYLLGRYKYRNRQYDEALQLFSLVEASSSTKRRRRTRLAPPSSSRPRRRPPRSWCAPARRRSTTTPR